MNLGVTSKYNVNCDILCLNIMVKLTLYIILMVL